MEVAVSVLCSGLTHWVVSLVVAGAPSSTRWRTLRPRLASRSFTSRISRPTLASNQKRSSKLASAVHENDGERTGGSDRLGRSATERTGVDRGSNE